jgi:DNA-binding transcriptional regulator PaaX
MLTSKDLDDPERQIARRILSYFLKHPSATDTFRGIVERWLVQEELDYTEKQIRKALDVLALKGAVKIKKYENQEEYYRLNKDKLGEIEEALKDEPEN